MLLYVKNTTSLLPGLRPFSGLTARHFPRYKTEAGTMNGVCSGLYICLWYHRCGYTGHFYGGKWPFYQGKLGRCLWPYFPEINLPWEISMVTSKRRKKPLTTFNGWFDTQGTRTNQDSSLDTNMKPQKKYFFKGFLPRRWEKDRCWHGISSYVIWK